MAGPQKACHFLFPFMGDKKVKIYIQGNGKLHTFVSNS